LHWVYKIKRNILRKVILVQLCKTSYQCIWAFPQVGVYYPNNYLAQQNCRRKVKAVLLCTKLSATMNKSIQYNGYYCFPILICAESPRANKVIFHIIYPKSTPLTTSRCMVTVTDSLCGSVGKDFVYHACGHEFESRLKWKFSNFPHHLRLLLSDYRGMAKCLRAHYNQEVRFSSAVKCKKDPRS